MEAQNEPKPKRKFVMTPERHAKLMANLAKARLAPKEKVYRKTPKRYAANIGNLEKANAKVRQQSESLRAGLEGLFSRTRGSPAPHRPSAAPAARRCAGFHSPVLRCGRFGPSNAPHCQAPAKSAGRDPARGQAHHAPADGGHFPIPTPGCQRSL